MSSTSQSLEDVYRDWIESVVSVLVPSSSLSSSRAGNRKRFGMLLKPFQEQLEIPCEFFTGNSQLIVRSDRQQWMFAFDSGEDVVPSFRKEKKDQTLVRRLAVALRSTISLVRLLGHAVDEASEIVWEDKTMTTLSRPISTAPETPPRPGREVMWNTLEVVSVPSSLGVLHVRVKHRPREKERRGGTPDLTNAPITTCPVPILNLDETYIQTHSLGGIEMVIETTTTGMTRINSSGSVAAVSARSFPAYSYQSSSEFICPRKYSEEGNFFSGAGSGGGSSEYSWEATEEPTIDSNRERIACVPHASSPITKFVEQPLSVASIVNEIERIRAQLIEYRIP